MMIYLMKAMSLERGWYLLVSRAHLAVHEIPTRYEILIYYICISIYSL